MEEVVLRDVHPARRHPEEGHHRAGGREQGDRAVHPAEPRPERAPADERDRKTGEEPGDHHEQEHLVRAQQGDHRAAVDPDHRRQGRDEERGERRVHGHRDGERDRRGPDDGQGGVGGGERGQGDARESAPGPRSGRGSRRSDGESRCPAALDMRRLELAEDHAVLAASRLLDGLVGGKLDLGLPLHISEMVSRSSAASASSKSLETSRRTRTRPGSRWTICQRRTLGASQNVVVSAGIAISVPSGSRRRSRASLDGLEGRSRATAGAHAAPQGRAVADAVAEERQHPGVQVGDDEVADHARWARPVPVQDLDQRDVLGDVEPPPLTRLRQDASVVAPVAVQDRDAEGLLGLASPRRQKRLAGRHDRPGRREREPLRQDRPGHACDDAGVPVPEDRARFRGCHRVPSARGAVRPDAARGKDAPFEPRTLPLSPSCVGRREGGVPSTATRSP